MKKSLTDLGAERGVLAGLCKHGKPAYLDVCDLIDCNTFTESINQLIYKCLEYIFQSSDNTDIPSILSTANTLGFAQNFSNKETEYLKAIFNFPVHLENVRNHAKKILKLHIARNAQNAHKEAFDNLDEIRGDESIDDILGISEKPILDFSYKLHQGEDITENIGAGGMDELKQLIENPIQNVGIPSPYPIYNELIGGGIRVGITLIAARLKTGKSTNGVNIAYHTASIGVPTLYIDTEMSKTDLRHKIRAKLSGVKIRTIETGKFGSNPAEYNKVIQSQKQLESVPLYYRKVSGKSFDEIISIMRRWIFQHVRFGSDGKPNPHVVVYDYFKLMDTDDMSDMAEHQALGFQVNKLSDFCGLNNTSCMAFVQSNRDGISKETSDIISQSDRIGWAVTSITIMKRKAPEEIAEDGPENGNIKMIPIDCRYGPGCAQGDYINMAMNGEMGSLVEVSTRSSPKK